MQAVYRIEQQQQRETKEKINKMMKCCSQQLLSPVSIYLTLKLKPSENRWKRTQTKNKSKNEQTQTDKDDDFVSTWEYL